MEFIGIDEGRQQLLRGRNGEGKLTWTRSLEKYPTARAMQRISDDELLLGYDRGYAVFRTSDGEPVKDCGRWKGVTSAYRTETGQTVLTGLNLEGRRGICTVTLDAEDVVLEVQNRRGSYVRLNTPMESGHYLLCANRKILETDADLNGIRKYRARGFLHAWKARPMTDGTILVSAGYGAFMARFDSSGRLLQKFGARAQMPPAVRPNFYASFDVDNKGRIFVANWQGHGPGNGNKGRQLLCFSPGGELQGDWSWPQEISSLQGLLLLESDE